ncbi:MAG: hypothetical protein Q9187_004814 [Circinaria calcarea]
MLPLVQYFPENYMIEVENGGGNEKLFSFERDPDEAKIEAVFNRPAKGYAKGVFERYWHYDDGLNAMLEEMSLITSGYAFAVSENLHKTTSLHRCILEEPQETSVSGDSTPSEINLED